MIEFKCKHCLTAYVLRPELAGRTAECKKCGGRFRVPYTSSVVRLDDADLAVDGRAPVAAAPIEVDLPPSGPTPVRVHRPEAFRRADRRAEPATAPPLLPLPPMVAELWLPLGLLLGCVGVSVYVLLSNILGRDGSSGGLILTAFAAASLVVIAFRLTLRTLESSAHTFDLNFSDAVALQAAACVSVPLLGGVIGLVFGGWVGTVVGVALGLVPLPLLLTILCQLPAGRGMQSGVLASVAFAVGYACSVAIVVGVANVIFSVWSIDLPWKVHPSDTRLAEASTAATTAPIAAAAVSAPLTPATASAEADSTPVEVAAVVNVASSVAATPPAARPIAPRPDAVVTPSTTPAALLASTVAPRPVPVAPPAAATPPEPLVRALARLDAEQHAEALALMKTFQDGLPIKPGPLTDTAWIDSLHIQAVAHLRLGQPARAMPLLQRLVNAGVTERTAVINAAVCDILQKQYAMRAVKILKPLVAANPQDELAVTLWGVALDVAAKRQRLTRLDELTADYLKANTVLERARPGQHHWGADWLSGSAWSAIEARRASVTTKVNAAKQELRVATTKLGNAKDAAQRANVLITGRPVREQELKDINRRKRLAAEEVDRCSVDVESARAAVENAEADMPRPN